MSPISPRSPRGIRSHPWRCACRRGCTPSQDTTHCRLGPGGATERLKLNAPRPATPRRYPGRQPAVLATLTTGSQAYGGSSTGSADDCAGSSWNCTMTRRGSSSSVSTRMRNGEDVVNVARGRRHLSWVRPHPWEVRATAVLLTRHSCAHFEPVEESRAIRVAEPDPQLRVARVAPHYRAFCRGRGF